MQFVTDEVFKELIKHEFPVNPTNSSETPQHPLSYEEQNALRCVAGYVCRKLRERLKSSSISKKDDMILGLMELN